MCFWGGTVAGEKKPNKFLSFGQIILLYPSLFSSSLPSFLHSYMHVGKWQTIVMVNIVFFKDNFRYVQWFSSLKKTSFTSICLISCCSFFSPLLLLWSVNTPSFEKRLFTTSISAVIDGRKHSLLICYPVLIILPRSGLHVYLSGTRRRSHSLLLMSVYFEARKGKKKKVMQKTWHLRPCCRPHPVVSEKGALVDTMGICLGWTPTQGRRNAWMVPSITASRQQRSFLLLTANKVNRLPGRPTPAWHGISWYLSCLVIRFLPRCFGRSVEFRYRWEAFPIPLCGDF